jgi:GT2 family glycosyltransferase
MPMQQVNPTFSIVIPNWNGKRFLDDCFNSIAALTVPATETIMVDNGSTDDSIAYTKKYFPWVTIVPLDKNYGFAKAVNEGIIAATGSHIFLLNNDTEVAPDFLVHMKSAIEQHGQRTFFSCKMLDFKDRTIIDRVGDGMTWTGKSYQRGELQKDDGRFDTSVRVFGACAGAAVYPKELFDEVGLFDLALITYMEDVDLDFRALLQGWECWYIPESRVYHIGSATAGKASAFSFRMMVRNHLKVIGKNFPTGALVKYAPKILYAEIRLAGAAVKHRMVKPYLTGLWQAFVQIPQTLRDRRSIQANRTATNAMLDAVIEKDFPYTSLRSALRK